MQSRMDARGSQGRQDRGSLRRRHAARFWLAGSDSADCCRFAGGPYLAPDYLGPGLAIAVAKDNPSSPRLSTTRCSRSTRRERSPNFICAISLSASSERQERTDQVSVRWRALPARSMAPMSPRRRERAQDSCSTRSFLQAHLEVDVRNLEGSRIGGIVQPRGKACGAIGQHLVQAVLPAGAAGNPARRGSASSRRNPGRRARLITWPIRASSISVMSRSEADVITIR